LTTNYGVFNGEGLTVPVGADVNGAFDEPFRLTADVPANVTAFTVTLSDSSGVVVSQSFAIAPPSTGPAIAAPCPGQSTGIGAYGLPIGTYTVTSPDATFSPSTVQASSDGYFATQMLTSDSLPLTYPVTLTSQSDPSESWTTIWRLPAPQVTITSVTWWSASATATCFGPGETVSLHPADTHATVPATVTATTSGTIAFSISLHPTAAPVQFSGVTMTGLSTGQTATTASLSVYGSQLHQGAAMLDDTPTMMLTSSSFGYALDVNSCNPLILKYASDGSSRDVWDLARSFALGNCRIIITAAGNVILYSDTNTVLWSTGTTGTSSGNYLAMGSNGVAYIITATGAVIWSSASGRLTPPLGARLLTGKTLRPGQHISNGNTQFGLLANGDIVVTRTGKTVWDAHTTGKGGVALTTRSDGDLVLANKYGHLVWTSGTGKSGSNNQIIVGANGDVAMYTVQNHRIWHTGTNI